MKNIENILEQKKKQKDDEYKEILDIYKIIMEKLNRNLKNKPNYLYG